MYLNLHDFKKLSQHIPRNKETFNYFYFREIMRRAGERYNFLRVCKKKTLKSLNTPRPDLKHVTKVKGVGQRRPIPGYCLPKYKK